MSGGKGGRSNTEVTMPAFAEEALQQGVGMSKDVSSLGYVPYYGPDVAAFSPQQEASFAATRQMAEAFGMPTGGGKSYLPETKTMGGVTGYSSGDAFDASVGELASRRPGQAAYLDSFMIDPMTGQAGSRTAANRPVELQMQGGRKGK